MTEWLHFHFLLSCIGEGNGNPLQCSCLENPRDGEAWWAAVYGVAQSQTWLKRLSSSSSSRLSNVTLHLTHLEDLLKQFLNLIPRVTDLFQSWMGLASGMCTSFPFDAEVAGLRTETEVVWQLEFQVHPRSKKSVCVCVCVCVYQVIHVHSKVCGALDLKRMNKGKSYLERLNSGTLKHLLGNKITTRKWYCCEIFRQNTHLSFRVSLV